MQLVLPAFTSIPFCSVSLLISSLHFSYFDFLSPFLPPTYMRVTFPANLILDFSTQMMSGADDCSCSPFLLHLCVSNTDGAWAVVVVQVAF